jgi:transketolase
MHIFRDANPERFFASTYSVFATRRAYDFLCLDIAEPGLNVNVVGPCPG